MTFPIKDYESISSSLKHNREMVSIWSESLVGSRGGGGAEPRMGRGPVVLQGRSGRGGVVRWGRPCGRGVHGGGALQHRSTRGKRGRREGGWKTAN